MNLFKYNVSVQNAYNIIHLLICKTSWHDSNQKLCIRHSDTLISLLTGARCSDWSSDRSFMVDPMSYFSVQPVPHDWCNKGRGMCYHVCGIMHIKEHLLLIGKSSPCGSSGFPLSLLDWSFTICPLPYNRK